MIPEHQLVLFRQYHLTFCEVLLALHSIGFLISRVNEQKDAQGVFIRIRVPGKYPFLSLIL